MAFNTLWCSYIFLDTHSVLLGQQIYNIPQYSKFNYWGYFTGRCCDIQTTGNFLQSASVCVKSRSNAGLIWWPCRDKTPSHHQQDLTLRWRHNERDSISNHQPHDCLLNGLFRRRSKKTWKLRVTGLCAGNSPGTGEFPAQMASNAENVSIWWRHHDRVGRYYELRVMFLSRKKYWTKLRARNTLASCQIICKTYNAENTSIWWRHHVGWMMQQNRFINRCRHIIPLP